MLIAVPHPIASNCTKDSWDSWWFMEIHGGVSKFNNIHQNSKSDHPSKNVQNENQIQPSCTTMMLSACKDNHCLYVMPLSARKCSKYCSKLILFLMSILPVRRFFGGPSPGMTSTPLAAGSDGSDGTSWFFLSTGSGVNGHSSFGGFFGGVLGNSPSAFCGCSGAGWPLACSISLAALPSSAGGSSPFLPMQSWCHNILHLTDCVDFTQADFNLSRREAKDDLRSSEHEGEDWKRKSMSIPQLPSDTTLRQTSPCVARSCCISWKLAMRRWQRSISNSSDSAMAASVQKSNWSLRATCFAVSRSSNSVAHLSESDPPSASSISACIHPGIQWLHAAKEADLSKSALHKMQTAVGWSSDSELSSSSACGKIPWTKSSGSINCICPAQGTTCQGSGNAEPIYIYIYIYWARYKIGPLQKHT